MSRSKIKGRPSFSCSLQPDEGDDFGSGEENKYVLISLNHDL